MKIIAFTAKKYHGKTTACDYLQKKFEEQGIIVIRLNFKDAMIGEIKQNFPDLLELIGKMENLTIDGLFIEKPPLVRRLMQNYGTEVRRRDNPDYWVNKYIEKINPIIYESMKYKSYVCLTDDLRFKSEAVMLKQIGGCMYRIKRYTDPTMTTEYTKDGEVDIHISETELDEAEMEQNPSWDYESHYKALDKTFNL